MTKILPPTSSTDLSPKKASNDQNLDAKNIGMINQFFKDHWGTISLLLIALGGLAIITAYSIPASIGITCIGAAGALTGKRIKESATYKHAQSLIQKAVDLTRTLRGATELLPDTSNIKEAAETINQKAKEVAPKVTPITSRPNSASTPPKPSTPKKAKSVNTGTTKSTPPQTSKELLDEFLAKRSPEETNLINVWEEATEKLDSDMLNKVWESFSENKQNLIEEYEDLFSKSEDERISKLFESAFENADLEQLLVDESQNQPLDKPKENPKKPPADMQNMEQVFNNLNPDPQKPRVAKEDLPTQASLVEEFAQETPKKPPADMQNMEQVFNNLNPDPQKPRVAKEDLPTQASLVEEFAQETPKKSPANTQNMEQVFNNLPKGNPLVDSFLQQTSSNTTLVGEFTEFAKTISSGAGVKELTQEFLRESPGLPAPVKLMLAGAATIAGAAGFWYVFGGGKEDE